MTFVIGSAEFQKLLSILTKIEAQMTTLQAAVAQLQTDVTALSAAVTANAANQFTAADVANIQSIDGQIKTLLAGLTPTPTPTTGS